MAASPKRRRDLPPIADVTALLTQAVENSSELVAMADCEGHLIFANQAFLAALGGTKDDVLGQHFAVALAPRNPPTLVQELGEKCLTDEGWTGECYFARRDGTAIPISLSAGPVKDKDGRVVGMFGIAQDITERKRVEAALQESEEQFRQLTEHIHDVFFALTPDPPRIGYVSPTYEEVWGQPRQTLYARVDAWIEAIHPDDRERARQSFSQSLLGSRTDVEFRVVRPDGTIRIVHARSFPVNDAHGRLCRVVGIARDVTARRNEEATLREAHQRLDRALRQSEQDAKDAANLTELVDMLQSCQTVNEAYTIAGSVLPTLFTESAGALCVTSQSRNVVEVVTTWGDDASTDTTFAPDHCWALRRGKVHSVESGRSPLRCMHVSESAADGHLCVPLAAQGETLGVLYLKRSGPMAGTPSGLSTDARALARQAVAVGERLSLAVANLRLREALRGQSIRDPLTGLFNRRYLEETLERELRRASRNKQSLAVLMIDIDHFKQFNDAYGHQAGDTLLRAFGDFVSDRTRGQDVACRYGGEEFAVILSGSAVEGATMRAECLRADLCHLVVQHAGQVLGKVTVSIGIAAFPEHGETPQALLQAADEALYKAKKEGRNRAAVA